MSSGGYITPDMPPDHWEEMMVTLVSDPSKFFLQSCHSKEELDEMMDNLEAYCNGMRAGEGEPRELTLGSPVIAKYDVDDGWYRAKITGK